MKYRIEFGDLAISEQSRKHLNDCVDTAIISGGPKVKQFEAKWGKLFGYEHNIAVSNGTDADIAACLTLYDKGAKRGDEIIAPALGFAAVGNSIVAAGFTPKFVDIERETMNIDPEKIEQAITPKTKAIMAVHTMGKPCAMDQIRDIADGNKLSVIEDSCEAHGAKYNGINIGHFGDASTFSFYVAHVISCGDGGMVSTNNPEVANLIKSVKDHGRKPGSIYFDHQRHGLNFRMNALTASIGLPELDRFHEIFNKRKQNLYSLLDQTKDLEDKVIFNQEEPHEITSPHAFSITLRDPKFKAQNLYNFLEENSIMCKRNFGSMPTQHKAFDFLGYKFGDFPQSEYVGDNGLHFGIHQYLSPEDIDYASEKIHKYFSKF